MERQGSATVNLKCMKKTLLAPKKFFEEGNHQDKACFSYGYRKYGYFDSWDIALSILNNLPPHENICNELILKNTMVKPYFDIEYLKEDHPTLDVDDLKSNIKGSLVNIFAEDYEITLDRKQILFSQCHRKTAKGFKISFHVVIVNGVAFENANCASSLAISLKKRLGKDIQDIVDTSVYSKTQNFRMIGHCKEGEQYPFIGPLDTDPLDFIVTNIQGTYTVLSTEEQCDTLYQNIKNIKQIDIINNEKEADVIFEKVKELHPSSRVVSVDTSGFIQFNYDDRTEPCFCHEDKEVFHDQIGFFAYIYNNIIFAGCHSGNCVNDENKKIIKSFGSLKTKQVDLFEKVEESNVFNLDINDVLNYTLNNCIGISDMFQEMYLSPKRIKWVNDTKIGSTFFWNGKVWKEDDFAFVDRLLVKTCGRVIKDCVKAHKDNEEAITQELEEKLDIASGMVSKLNSGGVVKNILNFVRPLMMDQDFLRIKDIHPNFLSCKNGMLDLFTGELRNAIPQDNITKCLDTCYNENADCSQFEDFLREITSDESGKQDKVYEYLMWCIGYSMQGNPKKKMFILLYGPHGFNGKSLLMNTISDVMQDYAVSMDKSVVMEGPKKTSGSHSTELCRMENARLGILSDTHQDAVIDDGQMKQITGLTDKLSVREIFGKQKEFTPVFVPFISTNHPVRINLTDKAMYERLVLFPFVLSFVDNPKKSYQKQNNQDLASNFRKNKEGVLKWLVKASVFYNQNQDFPIPEVLIKAKETYSKNVNSHLDFLQKNFVEAEDGVIKASDLLELYKVYSKDNNERFVSKVAEKEFDNLLETQTVKNMKTYTGIKYIEEELPDSLDTL
jgi:putative DNA primase/helicase